MRRLALRMAGRPAAAGVSAATLSRVERGDYLPGRENLGKLADWLEMSLSELSAEGLLSGHEDEPESTPEAIALHLRADKNLSPDDAEALEQMFRLAYERLHRRAKPAD